MNVKDFEIDPNMPYHDLSMIVYGERMCCAAPTGKPNNFTYEVLPPTCAKGILDGIFHDQIMVDGKKYPAFRSCPLRIAIIEHPDPTKRRVQGQYATIELNGVSNKISMPTKRTWAYNREIRQRFITYMLSPAFRIDFRISLLPVWKRRESDPDKNINTYREIFLRRIFKQQSYKQVHFGLNMFPAQFMQSGGENVLTDINRDLGPMIYDYIYDERINQPIARRTFWARITNGVLNCNWFNGEVALQTTKEVRQNVA